MIFSSGGSGVLNISSSLVVNGNVIANEFAGNLLTVAGNVIGSNILTAGEVSAQGNITAATGSFFIGDGSQLSNINAGNIIGAYGNANVAEYLASDTITTDIITIGNIFGANILGEAVSISGNITGAFFFGDGSNLTNINGSNIIGGYGNANVAEYLASDTITTNIFTTGNINGASISATGNITGSYILGNGAYLTGLPAGYSNADVSTYLASGNVTTDIITSGNVDATNVSVSNTVIISSDVELNSVSGELVAVQGVDYS
jgi:hypothetical protein